MTSVASTDTLAPTNFEGSLTVRQIGERESKKLVIQQGTRQQQKFNGGSSPDGGDQLTLVNAASCLKKAAYLVSRRQMAGQKPPQPQELHVRMLSLCLSARYTCLPLPFQVTSRLTLLRANILLKQSYVALRLESHSEALRFAKEILALQQKSQGALPGGVSSLARLYAGESLVFLDRIFEVVLVDLRQPFLSALASTTIKLHFFAQATEYLDPMTVPVDVSFDPSNGGAGEDAGGSINIKTNTDTSAGVACQAIFAYNLAVSLGFLASLSRIEEYNFFCLQVAFLTRGELDKSWEMLETLWSPRSRPTHRLGSRVLAARMYVLLKKGRVEECKKNIRENCVLEK